jgi:hypothetical protein
LLQGLWCVVTVAAAAIIVTIEAREKKCAHVPKFVGKMRLGGFLGNLTARCSTARKCENG